MSSPYIGEIRMFAASFAPAGWALCQGQLQPISENDALFVLFGTMYGGDGQETFGLPDLQGRVPVHVGTGPGQTYIQGEKAGVESVTLTVQQIPVHNHAMLASTTNQVLSPNGAYLASLTSSQAGVSAYVPDAVPDVSLKPNILQLSGGSQPHDNIQPTLCVSFIVSLFGIFPTQN